MGRLVGARSSVGSVSVSLDCVLKARSDLTMISFHFQSLSYSLQLVSVLEQLVSLNTPEQI